MKYLKVVLESLDTAHSGQPVHGIFSLDAAGRDVAFAMADIDMPFAGESYADIPDFFVVDAGIIDADRMATQLAQMGPTLLVEPGLEPLSVIADMLATVGGARSLHIIADGTESTLNLGGICLSRVNQAEAGLEWRRIGGELEMEAAVLIYSPISRESEDGARWLEGISECMGRAVITSNDLTRRGMISQAS